MSDSLSRAYSVAGMDCDHCVQSVTEAVTAVEGVEGADVDLESGRLEVRGDGFSDRQVATAVKEAGYEVVS